MTSNETELCKSISRLLVSEAQGKGFEKEIIELTKEKLELLRRLNEIDKRLLVCESEVERYIRNFNYTRSNG